MNINEIIRSDLRNFKAYSSARREANSGSVWLNANESPWDTGLNRYPDQQPQEFLESCARYYEVSPKNLLLTRGSDEGIDLLVRLFCEPQQDNILICPPTYGMYSISAQLQGAGVLSVPLLAQQGFQADFDTILASSKNKVKLVFLCSPNNPTGNLIDSSNILKLCREVGKQTLIVVDEAYLEFSAQQSLTKYILEYPNLIVLRTFSKAFGLAGVRVGALIADESVIHWLQKVLAPYPLPIPCIQTVMNALSVHNLLKVKTHIAAILEGRTLLANFLESCPFVKKIWPSSANYLLFECNDAQRIYDACYEAGIVLRNMTDKPNLKNCLRITIGLPAQNEAVMQTLRNVYENTIS